MPFTKGKSGNPGGRAAERAFANALRAAVNEEDPKKKRRKLQLVAERVVEEALNGESWACNMIADRLDGKPLQDVTIRKAQHARDLSDDELHDIARSGGEGIAAPANGAGDPDRVH